MKIVYYIFKREFFGYFVSPAAYIVISIFLLIAGWFFFTTFFLFNQASLRNFFALLPVIFSFIVPAITMRLFSEELSVGSYETLLTLPVKSRDVVIGKFLAACGFIAAMLAPTFAYPITVSFMGDLDWGPVLGGYIGALLLGSAFAGIGLFASSLTRNQIVAFIIGSLVCFSLTLIDKMLFFLPRSLLSVFSYLGADYHFQSIARGIIDSRDLLYFFSLIFVSLYASDMALQEKQ
jgi:ABC-2 type transport system permease protein